MSQRSQPIRLALAAFLAAASSSAARADCSDLRGNFDNAIASRSAPAIIAADKEIEDSVVCDVDKHAYYQRALDGVIDALPSTPNVVPPQDALDWLFGTLQLSGDWRSAEKFGKYFDTRGDRLSAQHAYELAVSLSGRNPASPATVIELRKLNNEAFAAKSLASYDAQGHLQTPYSRSMRDADGAITIYAVASRTVGFGKMPVPVNFVYDSTEMTEAGKAAAKEIADAVMQQQLESFKLIGHADPRGAARYNLKLSLGRAQALKEAVQAEIRSAKDNYLGSHRMPTIVEDGKGSDEPFDTSYLPYKPTQEEVYQLDRRVEFEFLDQ